MADKILLNKKESYVFTEEMLPCLVTYKEGTGGSHLSIVIVANLFLQGSKILFLTAYPMAKEKFLEQVGDDHSKIAFVSSLEDLSLSVNKQVIILESGNESLFIEVVKNLSDIDERITLVKNMEVFSEKVFEACLGLSKIILSGNIDTCVFGEKISKIDFKTYIAFNQPGCIFLLWCLI
jgi:hypothetical protein